MRVPGCATVAVGHGWGLWRCINRWTPVSVKEGAHKNSSLKFDNRVRICFVSQPWKLCIHICMNTQLCLRLSPARVPWNSWRMLCEQAGSQSMGTSTHVISGIDFSQLKPRPSLHRWQQRHWCSAWNQTVACCRLQDATILHIWWRPPASQSPPPRMGWVQNLRFSYIFMEPAKTHGIYTVLTSSASETVVFAAFCNTTLYTTTLIVLLLQKQQQLLLLLPLLRTTTYYYVLLRTTTYYYVLLRTTTYHYVLLRTTTYYVYVLRTTTYYYIPIHGCRW